MCLSLHSLTTIRGIILEKVCQKLCAILPGQEGLTHTNDSSIAKKSEGHPSDWDGERWEHGTSGNAGDGEGTCCDWTIGECVCDSCLRRVLRENGGRSAEGESEWDERHDGELHVSFFNSVGLIGVEEDTGCPKNSKPFYTFLLWYNTDMWWNRLGGGIGEGGSGA